MVRLNSDADRDTIQQRGIAVGDYDLTNYNHAYEGMSGYNGYPVVFGTNKTYANLVPNDGNLYLPVVIILSMLLNSIPVMDCFIVI